MALLNRSHALLGKARGWQTQAALWQFVRRGVLQVRSFDEEQLRRIAELMEQYHDAPMDLADASLVALAETLQLSRIFTLGVHFRAYRIANRGTFDIIP